MKDFSIFYRTSNVSKDFKNTLCAQYICISVSHSLEHLNFTSSAFPLFSSSSAKVERRTDSTIPTSILMFSWNRCEVCSWYSAHLELSLLLQHVVWGVLRAIFPHASCRDLRFQIAQGRSDCWPSHVAIWTALPISRRALQKHLPSSWIWLPKVIRENHKWSLWSKLCPCPQCGFPSECK